MTPLVVPPNPVPVSRDFRHWRPGNLYLACSVLVCLGGLLATMAVSAHADSSLWQVVSRGPDAVARFDRALEQARRDRVPVVVDFFASWCAACKKLDAVTFAHPDVRAEATRFVTIKVDATDDTPELEALQRRYGVVSLPTVVFIDGAGQAKLEPRITAFVEPAELLSSMRAVR